MNKILVAIGILCFLIPVGLQFMDREEQEQILATYEKEMERCDSQELIQCIENAVQYNQTLFELQCASTGTALQNTDYHLDYEAQLHLSKTGVMGNLTIPKIDLKLPIYHGTDEEVLANGIGHLEGSSLPVGCENSHSVLTGHRGLPSAELFTRLDEVEKGDVFFLEVCHQVMAYKVGEIRVVSPKDVSTVKIEADRDKVSLVTCTPYGINTHRLIVTGERMELQDGGQELVQLETESEKKNMYILFIPIAILCIVVLAARRRRRK